MIDIKQTYKTRSAAFREFIQPQGLPISERTFYNAVARHNMLQPDKSIKLADLVAYVKRELTPPPAAETPADLDRTAEEADLDIREKRARVKKLENENRKEDARWILREDSNTQQAAVVGVIYDTVKHFFHLQERHILLAVQADQARAAELGASLEEVLDLAFNDFASRKTVDVDFVEQP